MTCHVLFVPHSIIHCPHTQGPGPYSSHCLSSGTFTCRSSCMLFALPLSSSKLWQMYLKTCMRVISQIWRYRIIKILPRSKQLQMLFVSRFSFIVPFQSLLFHYNFPFLFELSLAQPYCSHTASSTVFLFTHSLMLLGDLPLVISRYAQLLIQLLSLRSYYAAYPIPHLSSSFSQLASTSHEASDSRHCHTSRTFYVSHVTYIIF